ncbi:MAG TPA: hypothetical protein VKP65_11325 [Rhodothermales bacterium]|nr:hypothetical protein [Rhodothermales bacterium]
MKKHMQYIKQTWLATLLLLGCLSPAYAQDYEPLTRAEQVAAYQARADSVIDFYAAQVPPDDLARGGYFQVAANLRHGQNRDWVLARLDSLMLAPRGDMFWMFPFVTAYFEGRDKLPDDYLARLRDQWRIYMPYRGDTENHWALYYATLYLMAEANPGEPGETWYTGKSSEENMAEAKEYLISWMDLTTTIGQGEYDSSHYLKVFAAPMALLYAHAQDPELKLRAQMMLDYIIADYAVDNLNGIYTGAHSRLYEREVVAPYISPAARFGWLLWGQGPFAPSGESYILAVSGYTPPEILHHIATDRSKPYTQKEKKRTRHRIRNSALKNAPVYKATHMRPEYALGFSQGGLLQPIQQQTWSLIWSVDNPDRETHNTFFGLHPYSSPREGTMYFAEHWDTITEFIVRSKTEYDSPDKWTGGSPFEQVYQEGDALIALYNIAPGTRFPHISAFFSRDLSEREEDDSGWIFARGGDALIAYYPMAPTEWQQEESGDWRLHSPHLKNGAVVQTTPASAYDSFDAFKEAVRALPLETETEPTPHVRFTTLDGTVLEATYGEAPVVDGEAVDYDEWKLFDGPFLYAERDSRKLEIRYGAMRRLLDFNTLTITEWVESADEETMPVGSH